MKSTTAWTAIGLILGVSALTGCEGKQHRLQRLQAEYATAYKQYQIDCVDPMSSGAADALTYVPGTAPKGTATKPKTSPDEEKKLTEKCQADDAKTKQLQQQLLDATTK